MAQPPPFASSDVLRVRRNPGVLALALSPLLLVAGFASPALAPDLVLLFPVLANIMWILPLVWARNPWPLCHRVAVRADMQGLEIGAHQIPRTGIRDGFFVPRRPCRLLLRRRFGLAVELEVASVDEGRALLRALGLGAAQTVAEFGDQRLIDLVAPAVWIPLAWTMINNPVRGTLNGGPPFSVMIILALGVLGTLAQLLTRARLAVGADGVVLSRLGRRRFIAYHDIDSVGYEERWWGWRCGVRVTLRSGEKVWWPMAQQDKETGAIIQERIREAMEVYAGGDGADTAQLRMGTRTVSEWITSLRAIGTGANADMRTAPFPHERLLRIVEDPTSPADDRAAAAVAVGASLAAADRLRLRSVADAVVAPRLRVVIEAAAGDDDAELETALAQVVEEMTKQRALAPTQA
jgi:hypothetical protein